jgi:hypothetical protein
MSTHHRHSNRHWGLLSGGVHGVWADELIQSDCRLFCLWLLKSVSGPEIKTHQEWTLGYEMITLSH